MFIHYTKKLLLDVMSIFSTNIECIYSCRILKGEWPAMAQQLGAKELGKNQRKHRTLLVSFAVSMLVSNILEKTAHIQTYKFTALSQTSAFENYGNVYCTSTVRTIKWSSMKIIYDAIYYVYSIMYRCIFYIFYTVYTLYIVRCILYTSLHKYY